MLALGETRDEVLALMRDLRARDIGILTIGQYLQPTKEHLPIERYVTPEEFRELKDEGMAMGFRHVESGPLVRSSYHAWDQVKAAGIAAPEAAPTPNPSPQRRGGPRQSRRPPPPAPRLACAAPIPAKDSLVEDA